MVREDIIQALLTRRKMSYLKAKSLVNLVLDSIAEELPNGPVCIVGFGCWVVKPLDHLGRNWKTGEVVRVKQNIVQFLLSDEFEETLNTDVYFD